MSIYPISPIRYSVLRNKMVLVNFEEIVHPAVIVFSSIHVRRSHYHDFCLIFHSLDFVPHICILNKNVFLCF